MISEQEKSYEHLYRESRLPCAAFSIGTYLFRLLAKAIAFDHDPFSVYIDIAVKHDKQLCIKMKRTVHSKADTHFFDNWRQVIPK